MAYLIDGNNFIGQITPHELKDPQSKKTLIEMLNAFQKVKRTKVLLVFDGRPDPDWKPNEAGKKPFSVIYPAFGQNADAIIKEIISKQTDLRRFFVVSSDREIRDYAKGKSAKSLSCIEFNRQLKSALKKYKKIQEMKKNAALPSPLEIDHWIEIFKGKK